MADQTVNENINENPAPSGAPAEKAGADSARIVGTAAILVLFIVIVAVILTVALRDKPRKDTSALAECNANNFSQFAYDGDTLYFAGTLGAGSDMSIYSVSASGEKTRILQSESIRRFRLCGDRILYLTLADGNYELCLTSKTGGDVRVLRVLPEKETATVTEFDLRGDTLYTLYDGVLEAVKLTDGTPGTLAEGVYSFVLNGDDLYYSCADGVFCLKKGAAEPQKVCGASPAAGLCFSGTRLYYRTDLGIFYIDIKSDGGEMIVVPDARVTSFCVRDGTVYYIRAVTGAEKTALAASMAQEQGIGETEAEELLTGVGHIFRVSGSGGTPTSVGGKYVAAFAMSPDKIYYKAFVYSRVFYEYVED